MHEHSPSGGFPDDARKAKEHPGRIADGPSQLGVPLELGFQAGEAFGAGVVLEEERQPASALDPDAIGVGAYRFAPGRGAATLGPPLGQLGAAALSGGADQSGEEGVGPDEVTELRAGGERGGGVAMPA